MNIQTHFSAPASLRTMSTGKVESKTAFEAARKPFPALTTGFVERMFDSVGGAGLDSVRKSRRDKHPLLNFETA